MQNLGLLIDEGIKRNEEKWIALNGCPAKCASKEFETYRLAPDSKYSGSIELKIRWLIIVELNNANTTDFIASQFGSLFFYTS